MSPRSVVSFLQRFLSWRLLMPINILQGCQRGWTLTHCSFWPFGTWANARLSQINLFLQSRVPLGVPIYKMYLLSFSGGPSQVDVWLATGRVVWTGSCLFKGIAPGSTESSVRTPSGWVRLSSHLDKPWWNDPGSNKGELPPGRRGLGMGSLH